MIEELFKRLKGVSSLMEMVQLERQMYFPVDWDGVDRFHVQGRQ